GRERKSGFRRDPTMSAVGGEIDSRLHERALRAAAAVLRTRRGEREIGGMAVDERYYSGDDLGVQFRDEHIPARTIDELREDLRRALWQVEARSDDACDDVRVLDPRASDLHLRGREAHT